MNIYEEVPVLESGRFLLRQVEDKDCGDLLRVYSDKNALPFFNSDNCDGDNFYYATRERMAEALGFWRLSYENGWFARLSIVDKGTSAVVGTVELCRRVSQDPFNNTIQKAGFTRSEHFLVGKTGFAYDGYWTR